MLQGENMLAELKSEQEEAFKRFFYTYYPRLVAFSASIVSDTQLSEDLVQEFFIDFWQKKRYRNITSLESYLYYSVKNLSLNAIRADKQNRKQIYRMLAEEPPHFTEIKIWEEEQMPDFGKIYRAIDRLPSARKQIFELCYFKNYKYRQVAEAMNLSVNTVKVQMGRALKFLRENSLFL